MALVNYWVGTTTARKGQTVAVGYVINNGTGHMVRVLLGASIKTRQALSWAGGTVSDPTHDVVAIVPPGVSTHVRYFSLGSVHAGTYDVAWGLRDANTGERDALVMAPSALRVLR